MQTNPVFIPAARRRHAKPRLAGPAPQPPASENIASVVHGPSPEILTVTVNGFLLAIGEVQGALAVVVGEDTLNPINADTSEMPTVYLTFAQDVSSADAWSVPDPAAWEFAGGPMNPPLSGTIE